jgi:phage virion morphogenesis protein|nr:MAG TPA: virion morphogenesis protein [Caudoviricetes sp.]
MIEVKALNRIEIKLKSLQQLSRDTEPLMYTLGNILKNEIEYSFELQSDPFGNRWAALKPATVTEKVKKGKSDRILRRDGNLADKWLPQVSKNEVVVSNNSTKKGFAYGLVHQFGSDRAGRGKSALIPARPFLPVDKSGNLPKRTRQALKEAVIKFILLPG